MVTGSEANYHHDDCRPTDLAALQADIIQTFAAFSAFLNTLTPLPMKTSPVQPLMAPMSVSTDNNDVLALLTVDHQWLMPTTHPSILLDASQWIFLHYSERYNNLPMKCKLFSTPCMHQLALLNAATTVMTSMDD